MGLAAAPAGAQPAVQLLRDAMVTPERPGATPDWARARAVTLPDDWAVGRAGESGVRWYRLALLPRPPAAADAAAPALYGLYVERACSVLQVWLNGQLIHDGGRFTEPVTRNCHRPQLVSVPASLLLAEGNRLELRLRGFALAEVSSRQRVGGLSAVEFGPYELMSAHHERRQVFATRAPEVLSGALLLMGSFMFVMGWFNRRQSYLAYFGALMVGWSLLLARLWVSDLPVTNHVSELLLAALMAFITWAAVQFLMRYAGHRLRWLDIALPLQCLLMPATLVAAGAGRLYTVAGAWFVLLTLQGMAAAVFYLVESRRQRSRQLWPMAALLATVVVSLAVDSAAQVLPIDNRVLLVAQLMPALGFLVLGLRLVQQYGRAFQSAEQNRAELEIRIREATAQIERNFAQLSELKVEQVTDRERKRIAADLHDDLGAKLLTIVHTSDSERISTLAREALEEMRLSVRGLTGKPVRLTDALGDWRAEVVSRLAQSGIQGEWSAPHDEDVPQTLSSRAYVQTTRILREAISNIIKHSGASQCSVRCAIDSGDFQLVIQDNGNGIPVELDGRLDKGHGMASMKGRAKQLQGQCLVESGPGYGTVIRLTLPLERHTTNA
ncbi:MAG: sensor histidine kinase [Burkholderiaceae bacterium]|nr:sensor histidine kinase [Burkholderiaceae bacterium]